MSVSYYLEPVYTCRCCKFFSVPPSGVSASIVQQEVLLFISTMPDRTRSRAHTSRRHRYGSVLFPNTTVEGFENIDEIMRRLIRTPGKMSDLEYTMRSMRGTMRGNLRYVESA